MSNSSKRTSLQRQRPFWLEQPCPPWCRARHRADDPPPSDAHVLYGRVHLVSVGAVGRLTEHGGGPGVLKRLEVHVVQGTREVEPRVVLVLDNPDDGVACSGRHLEVSPPDSVEEAVACLTLAELGELRRLLKRAERVARGEAGGRA